MTASCSGVAAFDFDGTLVPRDSFVAFLRLVGGPLTVSGALARSWPTVVTARSNPAWRDAVKSGLVSTVLTGRRAEEVEALAGEYASRVVTQVTAPMSALISRHLEVGHRTVIVSASLEIYLRPAARMLGIEEVIGTRLEVGDDGRMTGRLEGANCRGIEKARRLSDWMSTCRLDPDIVPLWAYGDSAGDREMLELARFATRVRRARPRAVPGPFI